MRGMRENNGGVNLRYIVRTYVNYIIKLKNTEK
jgi:hypothetical protein